jgi:phospholipid-binding lipoprotein MlaA
MTAKSQGRESKKEEAVQQGASRPTRGSAVWLAVAVLAFGFAGCAGPERLSDLTPTGASPESATSEGQPVASPQPPAPAGDATPQVILVSDPGTPAHADPAPAGPPGGEVLTPEAAQILKEHGYDLSDLLRNQSGTLQSAQLLRESLDPFAAANGADTGEIEEYDPWEKVNMVTFEFNYKLDKYVVKPVAKGYNFVMPDIAQRGISNFFQNIRVVPRLLNNVFQAKFKGAGIETGRFLINTTLGLGGLFDPAKAWFKLETSVEDTGQTFGRYGVKPGPYLVIPFLGSFTLRDGVGYLADLALDPFNWFVLPIIKLNGAPKLVTHNDTIAFAQLGMRAGQIVNDRSLNLEKFQGVEESTLDLYSAVRNAYLQQRAKLIRE